MIRDILEKLDTKFEEVCANENEKHPILKSAMIGVAEGAIDGCALVGAGILIIGYTSIIISKLKR